MRKSMTALAVFATLLAPAAWAASSGAESACEGDLSNTRNYVEQNRANLTEQAFRDAQRRLEVARSQCNSEPLRGQVNLSALQRDLDMDVRASQTAQMPDDKP